MASDIAERVRTRLRDEMSRRGLSQQELADLLQWSQSRVAQKLTGRTVITLEELEALCFGVGLSLVEVVRQYGLEFCAEMTPAELTLLQRFRALTPRQRDAWFLLFEDPDRRNRPLVEERRAMPPTRSVLRKKYTGP